jgi:hypothetical protein
MPESWSAEEVAATVADYFEMLRLELRRVSYNKTEHRRQLIQLLNDRSGQAIEFKHANISAILIELGLPYISGYRPRSNYQELLKGEVEAYLERHQDVELAALEAVRAAAIPSLRPASAGVFVDPPIRSRPRSIYERASHSPIRPRRVNYLEMEARNASLGAAGELFVMAAEHRRLWEAGKKQLADRIDHVSATQGDGLGYDIVSFEPDGRERLIEVKTTTFGSMTPFFASENEVRVSETRSEAFHLYRVFRYSDDPKIFTLPGSLRSNFELNPTVYRASILG